MHFLSHFVVSCVSHALALEKSAGILYIFLPDLKLFWNIVCFRELLASCNFPVYCDVQTDSKICISNIKNIKKMSRLMHYQEHLKIKSIARAVLQVWWLQAAILYTWPDWNTCFHITLHQITNRHKLTQHPALNEHEYIVRNLIYCVR